jgi:hypothetical protein
VSDSQQATPEEREAAPERQRAIPEEPQAKPQEPQAKPEAEERQATSDERHATQGEQPATFEKRRGGAITIAEIALADEPQHWEALGFAVRGNAMWLGDVRVVLAGSDAGQGMLGWSLRGIADTALDGLPTTISQPSPRTTPALLAEESPSTHPNGIRAIDHVVAMSPDLDRGIETLEAAGLDLRRIRERPTPAGAPRQAFFRLGGVILELVQEPWKVVEARPPGRDGPARFWGLALLTDDIEHTVSTFAGHCGAIRPAVQYGRWIATVKRSAGLAVPVALMSPAVE